MTTMTAAAEMLVATTRMKKKMTKKTTVMATVVAAVKAVTSEGGEGERLGEGARQRLTQAGRKGRNGGTEAN